MLNERDKEILQVVLNRVYYLKSKDKNIIKTVIKEIKSKEREDRKIRKYIKRKMIKHNIDRKIITMM